VQKGGTAPISGVLGYADQVKAHGLNLVCSPGNDLVSTTALTAAGAHLVLFSTGRGTPFGAPVPTVKVFTNTALAHAKPGWMDFNAGVVADGGRTLDEAAADLWQLVLDTAGGHLTASERHGYRSISIWKDGVVL
jgi:altronate hydrolase